MPNLEPWKVVSSRTVYSAPPYLTVHSHGSGIARWPDNLSVF
jgi:hypothetical protein